jgi:hypothetical protein
VYLIGDTMEHRHLNHNELTLAAIDDIVSRGKLADWEYLRDAVRDDPGLLKKLLRICLAHTADPYSQRYHFWLHYAEKHIA